MATRATMCLVGKQVESNNSKTFRQFLVESCKKKNSNTLNYFPHFHISEKEKIINTSSLPSPGRQVSAGRQKEKGIIIRTSSSSKGSRLFFFLSPPSFLFLLQIATRKVKGDLNERRERGRGRGSTRQKEEELSRFPPPPPPPPLTKL